MTTFEEWADALPGPWLRIGMDRGWIQIPQEPGEALCIHDMGAYPVGSACPRCGHSGLAHPMAGNPAVTHCLLCEIADWALSPRSAVLPGPSIGLSPEEAEKHQPRRLVEQVGPAIWCTCGVSLWAPTEQALARMWREHLITAVGLLIVEDS